MLVTQQWINDYLTQELTAQEQSELMTAAGFPLEATEELPSGDVRQDIEMISNRGDCTCHVGLAREISARTGKALVNPPCEPPDASGCPVSELASVQNDEPDLCPLYTARIIQGSSVAESPDWLKSKIENRGDTPRNAIVDVSNFVLFELGQPTHVFDLDKVAGKQIVVRMARDGEKFLPLGDNAEELELSSKDLVIADKDKPIALAGVKGGAASAVTLETKNLLIESATFDPVTVRETSRRHNIASDSSFRFERGVDARQIEPASNRLVQLLLEVGGGSLCEGVLTSGKPLPEAAVVKMRTDFCRQKLGVDIDEDDMVSGLERLGFSTSCTDGVISCEVPYFRGDIHREIDLVEEVGRVYGFDNIPVANFLEVCVPEFGGEADGMQAVFNALAGMGFVECVTHSLISNDAANPFLRNGESPLVLEENGDAAEPVLRPSIIPSLLRVRKHNADNGIHNLMVAEFGSVFKLVGNSRDEHVELALLFDAEEGDGIGAMRSVLDRICQILTATTNVAVTPTDDMQWLEPGGSVSFDGNHVGCVGRLSGELQRQWDVPATMHLAQLQLGKLFSAYPPDLVSKTLPTQPAIERDVSAILDEKITWEQVHSAVTSLELPLLESVEFVTVFRGKGVEDGKKSLTLRLRFRDQERTLTHEEVDVQVTQVIETIVKQCNAEIRS